MQAWLALRPAMKGQAWHPLDSFESTKVPIPRMAIPTVDTFGEPEICRFIHFVSLCIDFADGVDLSDNQS